MSNTGENDKTAGIKFLNEAQQNAAVSAGGVGISFGQRVLIGKHPIWLQDRADRIRKLASRDVVHNTKQINCSVPDTHNLHSVGVVVDDCHARTTSEGVAAF